MIKTKQELISEWRKDYGYDTEPDEQIWKEFTDLSHLYGDFEENDDWYHILNCMCKETYDFFFTNEKILKIQVKNAHMNTCSVRDMVFLLARKVHNGVKNNPDWLNVVELGNECELGK